MRATVEEIGADGEREFATASHLAVTKAALLADSS